jgi:hypothetical protein
MSFSTVQLVYTDIHFQLQRAGLAHQEVLCGGADGWLARAYLFVSIPLSSHARKQDQWGCSPAGETSSWLRAMHVVFEFRSFYPGLDRETLERERCYLEYGDNCRCPEKQERASL